MERGFRPFRTQPEKHLADRADRIEITLVEGNILQERRELRTIQADSGCNSVRERPRKTGRARAVRYSDRRSGTPIPAGLRSAIPTAGRRPQCLRRLEDRVELDVRHERPGATGLETVVLEFLDDFLCAHAERQVVACPFHPFGIRFCCDAPVLWPHSGATALPKKERNSGTRHQRDVVCMTNICPQSNRSHALTAGVRLPISFRRHVFAIKRHVQASRRDWLLRSFHSHEACAKPERGV